MTESMTHTDTHADDVIATLSEIPLTATEQDLLARRRVSMINGYRYALTSRAACLNRIDQIDADMDYYSSPTWDGPVAGKSSVPQPSRRESRILGDIERKRNLEERAARYSAAMEDVHRFLQSLSESELDLVIRYYDLGQSYTEIADDLFWHRTTVMRRLRAIMRKR